MTRLPEPDSGTARRDLTGCEVLVTRPEGQNRFLIDAINGCGGVAHTLPTLAIEPVQSPAAAPSVEARLQDADLVLFTSVNAVRHAGPQSELRSLLGGSLVGAVGAKTASALREVGVCVHLEPGARQRYDSEALLALEAMTVQRIQGCKVVVVKGAGGRGELTAQLRARGGEVEEVDVYRRVRPAISNTRALRRIREDAVHAAVATSAEGLRNLFTMLQPEYCDRLRQLIFVTVSQRVASVAQINGIETVVVAEQASDNALLASLVRCWAVHLA